MFSRAGRIIILDESNAVGAFMSTLPIWEFSPGPGERSNGARGHKAGIEGVLEPRQPHRGVSTPPAAVRMRNDEALASRTIFSTS